MDRESRFTGSKAAKDIVTEQGGINPPNTDPHNHTLHTPKLKFAKKIHKEIHKKVYSAAPASLQIEIYNLSLVSESRNTGKIGKFIIFENLFVVAKLLAYLLYY